MDGEFACPSCGHEVKAPDAAAGPGRRTRCSHCDALVEVPFLPRVEGDWKHAEPRSAAWRTWVRWGAAACAVALLAVIAVRVLVQGEIEARRDAIRRLVESSRTHEAEGRFDRALLDLDTALMAAAGDDDLPEHPDAIRERRGELARRDAQAAVAGLDDHAYDMKTLGEWLDLTARVRTDRDLTAMRADVVARFDATLDRWLDDLEARIQAEPDPAVAFEICGDAADLAVHLPPSEQDAVVGRFRGIAAGLVSRRGVTIEEAPGVYVRDTAAKYEEVLRAPIVEALRGKGYLPPPARWGDLWDHAPYRFSYLIRESFEGNYMGTPNRLTRIDATLTLTGPGGEIWKTMPNARSNGPTSGKSSYLAGRLALASARSDEAERLLHDDAFARIRERIAHALSGLSPLPPFSGTR